MSHCQACGTPFSCAMVDGSDDQAPCWCTQLPPLMPLPNQEDAAVAACYCRDCLQLQIDTKLKSAN